MTKGFAVLAAIAVLFVWFAVSPADAQTVFNAPQETEQSAEIPEELSPELVDGLLARMTDAEIRALLRDELIRRAEETRASDSGVTMALDEIGGRLAEMTTTIESRVTRWIRAIRNIENRQATIARRLDQASSGVAGMLAAAALLLTLSIAAAWAVHALTGAWRRWLKTPVRDRYWDRVLRTAVLGLVDLLPLAAFMITAHTAFGALEGPLGPLHTADLPNGGAFSYVFIFEAGIAYCWGFILLSRRAFAPDAPAIRIAPVDDALAGSLHRLLSVAVCIGAGGWLLGGMMLNLGLGFPPVMITRALTGTLVALVLLAGLWRKRRQIRLATAAVFGPPREIAEPTTMAGIAITAAPWALSAYILLAWVYWLAHWLETGADRLDGPAGTLVVYLVLPIFDRMGRQVLESLLPPATDLRRRLLRVMQGAWRLVIGFVAMLGIARLWGLNILGLAKGPDAPAWASTSFDVSVTLLAGYLVWRLVLAALHTERSVSTAAEDVDPSSVPAASRLKTLTPLFRNILLGFLAIVIAMIVLSSMGIDTGPLIASAGIVGIAVGFGAQSLVRDIFSGIFFLVDDAFRVGEYIELDTDMRGEVEAISIRSLQLRHHRGAVITIPFGELKQITNHNRDWVIYKMSFRMEPDTDPQKFKKLVKNVGKKFLAHPEHGPKFLEPLKSQGVYYVDDDSALVMRVKFKCKPRAQFVLRREIYHRLRTVFAEADLHLARRKVEVVGPDGPAVPEATRVGLPEEVLTTAPTQT